MASAAVLVPPDAPERQGDGRELGVLAAWARLAAHIGARAYRSFLLTLLVVAVLPALWSWSSFVVRSGSMEPSISVGDVVVAKPFAAAEEVPLGRVVVFKNPAKPGDDELLVHRVVERLGGGEFVTAGDANATDDATPITGEDVEARATLLVPFVGRPMVWAADGNIVPLVLWSALTVLALCFATRRFGRRRKRDDSGAVPPGTGGTGPERRHRGLPRRRTAAIVPTLALLVAGGLGVTGAHTASAGFTGRTVSPSNTWTVSGSLAHRVSLASPGAVLRGSVPLTATLSNTGADDGYTVRMQYALPGKTTWTTVCTKSSAPYSCSWATSGFANGAYDLRAVATSATTTVTSSVVRGVLVDNQAPAVAVQDPGTPLRGTVTFAATASDAHSGVARVVIQYVRTGSATYQDLCSLTDAPYSCKVNTASLANGTYSFRAVAIDVAGNSTTSAVIANRVVDNVTTTIVMKDPGEILVGTVTVGATASSTAGVASVRFQGKSAGGNDWADVCVDTTSPYSCSFDTEDVDDGLYDLRAIVTDLAGRTTTSEVLANRRVDNTAPRGQDVQTTNGGVAGRLDAGDTMSYTYTEKMALDSISSGWDGSAVPVSLRLRDGRLLRAGGKDDSVDILRGGSSVNLGSINLREDYISNNSTVQFNATMTASTTTVNGVAVTRVTITVGSQTSGGNSLSTVKNKSVMTWSPSSLATDLGGIATSTSGISESGTSDIQF